MRFIIPITAVTITFFSLAHARVHHIYQSCKDLPLWDMSYTAAIDLLKLTIEILERPKVPDEIIRLIDGLFAPPRESRIKAAPVRPGTPQWVALLGT
jgi:hypothetical protein